jgi:fibronectin-binding autotransporter adhesin
MTSLVRLAGVLAAAVGFFGGTPTAQAQTFTWNTDASASWNTAGNWNPAGIPNGQGVTAVFGNVITAARTVSIDSPVTVGTLSFTNAPFEYTIGGFSTIALNNGASPALVTMSAGVGAHQRIHVPVTALNDVTITNDSIAWRLFLNGGFNIGSHTLTVTGPGIVTFGSANGITGSGGLVVQDGTGELRLTASNSGVKFVVNSGTLVAGFNALNVGSFTADLVTVNDNAILRFENGQGANTGVVLGTGGGRFEVLDGTTITFPGVVSGSTALTKVGAGKLALTGVNTYTGDTIIRDGTLRVEANVAPGVAGPLGNSTTPIFVGDNVGSNSTALLVGGTGAVTISRDITVVASAAPGASTVTIGSEGSSASNAIFTGTLTLNRSAILTTGLFTPSVTFGKITGTGGVTVAGSGITKFTSSASDFTGTITIGTDAHLSGALEINADNLLGASGNALFFNGGTLRVTGSTPFSTNRAIALGHVNGVFPSGTIDVQNTDTTSGFTISSAITGDGPFRKTGPGILTLSGANTNGYTTFVEQGTVRVTAANVLSPNSVLSVTTGAAVQLNGFSQQVFGLQNPTSLNPGVIDLGTNPSMVLTVGKQGQFGPFFEPNVFTGGITGTGNLVKTGLDEQQLAAGGVSFTGTTTVRQGVLEFTTAVPANAGNIIRLGDPDSSGFDAVIFTTDKSGGGFARPLTVAAGSGSRTIGHQLSGSTHNGSTVTFSGDITLGKDLQLYSAGDGQGRGSTLRVSGVVGGAGGLVNIGAGTTTLTADNTYTGTTTVLKGQLIIGGLSLPDAAARSSAGFVVRTDWNHYIGSSFNPLTYRDGLTHAELAIHDFSPNPNRIGDVDVTLAGGKFTYWGQTAGASSESFKNLVLNRGPNTLVMTTANNANTTSATISMTGGFVRNSGDGTLVVVSQNTLGKPDGGDYTRVLATTAPTLLGGGGAAGSTNISIIPWAYHDTDPSSGAATTTETFLTYGATGLRPLEDAEYVTTLTAAGTLNNVRITAASTTLSQNQTINALRYGLSASGTITLTNQTLTINSGAILNTSSGSANSLTFNGGELAFGTAEAVIHSSFGGNVIINSVVSGSGGLTSNVLLGRLELNGANTYTGSTTIHGGGVWFNSAASFGAGGDPIRFRNAASGGGMTYTGAGTTTLPNPIEISPYATGINVNNGGTLRLNGVISGTSGITTLFLGIALGFSGNGTIELRAANTFTGSVGLTSGTLGIIADNNFGASGNLLGLGGGTTNTPTLRFDAADITIARPVSIGGHIALNTNGFDATISGTMTTGQSSYNLTKTGAGVLTLTGTNTHFATTQVSGGTLRVNGVLAFFSTAGGVNVNNGGTLGGSGTIDRVVTVNNGGTLAPGASPGTLTVNTLSFAAGANATYEWEAGATVQDQIVVTNGPLNLTGISLTFKLYDRGLGTGVTPDQMFPLITVAGVNTITGFNPANMTVVFADAPNWAAGQYTLSVANSGGNSVLYLTNLAPVPEPAGLLAIAGAALALFARRRVRSRATATDSSRLL